MGSDAQLRAVLEQSDGGADFMIVGPVSAGGEWRWPTELLLVEYGCSVFCSVYDVSTARD